MDFNPNQIGKLDTTVSAGAKKLEAAYHYFFRDANSQFTLRMRNRIGGMSFKGVRTQSSGNSGKAQNKVSQKNQARPKPMVLVLDPATGRRKLMEA